MLGHEAPDSCNRRVFPETSNFSVTFHSVIFESLQGNCLIDTLNLLWLSVNLLLALLTASAEPKHQVQSTFLLNIVITQRASILQLLSSKDETLLIRWDSLFILDLCLHIINSVWWLDIQCNCLACEKAMCGGHGELVRECTKEGKAKTREAHSL